VNKIGKNRQNYGDAFFNLNQINQLKQRFRFCWLNKSYYYFRSVKFHYVKETDTRYWVSSLSALEEIVAAQKTTKEIFVKICWELKTPIRTWKCTCCTMQMSCSQIFANSPMELNKRSNNRLSKIRLVVVKYYQSRQFSFITFLEQMQRLTRSTWLCEQIMFIHSVKLFSTLKKLTFSISSGHKTTCKSPRSYSLPSLWKIFKRLSPNSPFWSGNVTASTWEPPTCAWIRADIWRQDGAICSKNRKIVPSHGCVRILRVTVSIPDYDSCLCEFRGSTTRLDV